MGHLPLSGVTDDIQPTQGHGKWVKRVLVSEQGGGILGRETVHLCPIRHSAQGTVNNIGLQGWKEPLSIT